MSLASENPRWAVSTPTLALPFLTLYLYGLHLLIFLAPWDLPPLSVQHEGSRFSYLELAANASLFSRHWV